MRISDWSSDVCSSDLIGAAGNVRAGLPDRLGVAVAQLLTDVLAADEGRVADDELRLRPTRRTRVLVGAQLAARVLVGHRFAGHRVQRVGDAVPAGDRLAASIGSASCRERVCQYV